MLLEGEPAAEREARLDLDAVEPDVKIGAPAVMLTTLPPVLDPDVVLRATFPLRLNTSAGAVSASSVVPAAY